MKKVVPIWLNRSFIFFMNASFLFFTLFLLISELRETDPQIQGYIYRVNGTSDTLQTFSNAIVLTKGEISINELTSKMRYLGPRPFIDPIYALLFFLSALIMVFFFWNFDYKNPFTKKTLLGLQIAFCLFIIFFIINFFRYDWFAEQVKLLTNGQFKYEKPLLIPEFLMLFVLFRLIKIFKKGIGLQRDNDLTV